MCLPLMEQVITIIQPENVTGILNSVLLHFQGLHQSTDNTACVLNGRFKSVRSFLRFMFVVSRHEFSRL